MPNCKHCSKEIPKQENIAEKYKKKFCNSKCAASFNNRGRTKVDTILERRQEDLKVLMFDNTPATAIAKLLKVSYDTFKRRYPDYRPQREISFKSTASLERIERVKQKKKSKIFKEIKDTTTNIVTDKSSNNKFQEIVK
jgi:transposase-like protein